jgi:hypothetical protein
VPKRQQTVKVQALERLHRSGAREPPRPRGQPDASSAAAAAMRRNERSESREVRRQSRTGSLASMLFYFAHQAIAVCSLPISSISLEEDRLPRHEPRPPVRFSGLYCCSLRPVTFYSDPNRVTKMERTAEETAAAVEEALKDLRPEDRRLVQNVLDTYPGLTAEKAIEMLREFGGLARL